MVARSCILQTPKMRKFSLLWQQGTVGGKYMNEPLNWPTQKTPVWYTNFGIIFYTNRLAGNTAVRGLNMFCSPLFLVRPPM